MIRKISSLMIVGVFVLTIACKKEDASSKIDPNATEIAPADPNAVLPVNNPTAEEAPKTELASPPVDGKYPKMTFAKKEHNFGDITQGDKVNHTFTFKNTGEADLIITDAKASCGCTVPEYPKTAIKPGEAGKLKVSFDSTGKSGESSKTVTITCNTESGTELLTIKSNIKVPN